MQGVANSCKAAFGPIVWRRLNFNATLSIATIARLCHCNQSGLTIGEKCYAVDEWTNVPPSVCKLVARSLLHEPGSPLRLVKLRIVDYFNEKFKNNFGNPLFPLFDSLEPVVTIEQNFNSLLVPPTHVCRSKSDTYYLNKSLVLRTHTSAHQAELIKSGLDSFIVAGDVYRRDEIDRNHYPCFHQMEGVHLFHEHSDLINRRPLELFASGGERCAARQECHTFTCVQVVGDHLKNTLEGLIRHLLPDKDLQLRWTDTYFPFTHPSWELEIMHGRGWLEILGCGVVEQKILNNSGAADRVGWAFGIGMERLAMLLYNIPDIRLFWSKDTGFLSQFHVRDHRVDITYKPLSRYPQCINDIAFWLPKECSSIVSDFNDLVRGVGRDTVEQVTLIDDFVHPKSGRRSNCFRVVYRHMEKTLTQKEVNEIHRQIEQQAVSILGVEIR